MRGSGKWRRQRRTTRHHHHHHHHELLTCAPDSPAAFDVAAQESKERGVQAKLLPPTGISRVWFGKLSAKTWKRRWLQLARDACT